MRKPAEKQYEIVTFRDGTFGIRYTYSFLGTGWFEQYKYQDKSFIDLMHNRDSGMFEERCKFKSSGQVAEMIKRLKDNNVDYGEP